MPMEMSGSKVTLDLSMIDAVADCAVAELSNNLQERLRNITEEIRSAAIAKSKGDSHAHYIGLCHANTQREYLERTARQLAEAIHVKFHVAEAIKRDEVEVVPA
jgi:hypothetical protein